MLPQGLYEDLKNLLSQQFHERISTLHFQPVGGGSINQTFKLTFSNAHTLFCKINSASAFAQLFQKEREGLEALRSPGAIKTPSVIACSILDDYQVLILEWIQSGAKTHGFFKKFGEQLAALNHTTAANFGWESENYMGSVPQQNGFHENWTHFFIHQRLEPLVQKCLAKNLLTQTEHELFKKLYSRLPQLFNDDERPALLHGDLWSGNYMCNPHAEPVLIDPAVYYGHRSMDLAMTTLFGGFDAVFYEAYNYHFPLPANYKEQYKICNLYPMLIHLLLFGKSYLTPIQQTITVFL